VGKNIHLNIQIISTFAVKMGQFLILGQIDSSHNWECIGAFLRKQHHLQSNQDHILGLKIHVNIAL